MRKPNDVHIKDAIGAYLKELPLGKKLTETGVIMQWAQIVGSPVANRTSKIYISNRRLYVKIDSSVVKNDLYYFKPKIIEQVNERAGTTLIDDVIFI